jgi:hypothetical protein
MDPLLDEKLTAIIKSIMPEFTGSTLRIQAHHEAYGPSLNEGLCYESVNRIDISGDINAKIYFCMDGYTKLQLLPKIAEWKEERVKEVLDGSAIASYFVQEFGLYLSDELDSAGYFTELSAPSDLSHRLVPVNADEFRQYILIFFLKDLINKEYTGRIYIILAMSKNPPASDLPVENR